jgi:tetratricopeptide (TPR) repeat protein
MALSQGCAVMDSSSDLVAGAELAVEQGRYDEALESYRLHRDERLAVADRPEWENPHFYTLLMGDVELRRGNPESALKLYTQADQEHLSSSLVTDRYRAVAAWYLESQRFDEALEILKRHRGRDPLLFDAMLDKVAKRMTKSEESHLKTLVTHSSNPK